MEGWKYWFLAVGKEEEDTPGEEKPGETVVSIPWFIEVQPQWVYECGPDHVRAPVFYTAKRLAEEGLRDLENNEADAFLGLKDLVGEEVVNLAYDNTASLQVFGMAPDKMLDKLEDCDFLCVVIDGTLRLRQDLIEELREQAEQG